MSIWFSSDSHIPTNVVEVGNEISQNSLNGLTFASPAITSGNPVAGVANLNGLCAIPTVATSSSGYNQQYDINGNAFYFSSNYYPLELTFTASSGQSIIVPARSATCPAVGTSVGSPYIDWSSSNSLLGPSGESTNDSGYSMYYRTQYQSTMADGNCGEIGTGSWPSADQNISVDSNGNTTQYFSGNGFEYRTDGSGSAFWYQTSSGGGGGGGCSGDTGNTSTRGATIYINELGGDYVAGYFNTKETYYEDCSTYWQDVDGPWWNSYGTYITSNGDYTYYSNGDGGWYSEYTGGGGGGGPSYNEGDSTGNTSNRDAMVYVSELNAEYAFGTIPTAEYYHSDGSTYWSDTGGPNWFSSGTYIGNDGMADYYMNGDGTYRNYP